MINKGDFIELEFTGRISNTGEIFDTNINSDAKNAGLNIKEIKPLILCVGHKMIPEGLDEDLIGKDKGSYKVTLKPQKAFGARNPQLVRMIPTKLFHEQKINPVRGMQLSLDGQLVRVLSSSSGRTLVDFNNPLAGKEIEYSYNILRKIEDTKEKIDAIQDFFFRKKFEYDLKEDTLTFKAEKEFEPFVKMISPKFEEILGLKVMTELKEETKPLTKKEE